MTMLMMVNYICMLVHEHHVGSSTVLLQWRRQKFLIGGRARSSYGGAEARIHSGEILGGGLSPPPPLGAATVLLQLCICENKA